MADRFWHWNLTKHAFKPALQCASAGFSRQSACWPASCTTAGMDAFHPKLLKAAAVEMTRQFARAGDPLDMSPAAILELMNDLPAAADLGLLGCVEPILMHLCEHSEPSVARLAQSIVGLRETSRGLNLTRWSRFFAAFETGTTSTSDPRFHALVARGAHARAMRLVQSGDSLAADRAASEAAEAYALAGDAVGALKAQVVQVMTLRIRGEIDSAITLATSLLEQCQKIGWRAVSPAAVLLSTLAGDHLEAGQPWRARNFAWQAARIATALPASKSAAFALFQYGRVEFTLGHHGKALAPLKKALAIQERLDPVAAVATRMLELQCHLRAHDFAGALPLARRIADDPRVLACWDDYAEFARELTSGLVTLGDECEWRTWRDRILRHVGSPQVVASASAKQRQEIRELISRGEAAMRDRWEHAKLVRAAPGVTRQKAFLIVDRVAGVALGRDGQTHLPSLVRRGGPGRENAAWLMLEELLSQCVSDPMRQVDIAVLGAKIGSKRASPRTPDAASRCVRPASMRRTLQRAADELAASRLVHVQALKPRARVAIAPALNVYVFDHAQVVSSEVSHASVSVG